MSVTIQSEHFSRDIWMIMGSWLLMIGFFVSENYLFSFLNLDDFEIKMWTAAALFLTASACYLYSIVQSRGWHITNPNHD